MKNWKMSTKILVVAGFILILVIILFLTWWVQNRSRREMKEDAIKQILQVEAIMSQPQKEQIALLALKYEVEEGLLEKILADYSAKHDVTQKVKSNLAGEVAAQQNPGFTVDLDFAGTINALSLQYNVPKERIAALLIDYRVMAAVDKGNAIERLLSTKAKQSIVKFSMKELLENVKKMQ